MSIPRTETIRMIAEHNQSRIEDLNVIFDNKSNVFIDYAKFIIINLYYKK